MKYFERFEKKTKEEKYIKVFVILIQGLNEMFMELYKKGD